MDGRSTQFRWLRVVYAAVGAIECLGGSIFGQFFGSAVRFMGSLCQAMVNWKPGEASGFDALLGSYLQALRASERDGITFARVSGAALLVGLFAVGLAAASRRWGPRAAVWQRYRRHQLKFALERDERAFLVICFGSGVGLSLWLNSLFLIMLAVHVEAYTSPEEWAAAEAAGTSAVGDADLSRTSFWIFKHAVLVTTFWGSLAQPDNRMHQLFQGLIILPVLLAVPSRILVTRHLVSSRVASTLLRWVAATGLLAVGTLQWSDSRYNPLASLVVEGGGWIPTDWLGVLIRGLQAVTLAILAYDAVEHVVFLPMWDYDCRDPLRLYRLHLVQAFSASMVLCGTGVLLLLGGLPVPAPPPFGPRAIQVLMAYFTIVRGSVLVEPRESEEVARKLAARFSRADCKRSVARWGRRIRAERAWRDRVLVTLLVAVSVVMIVAGGRYSMIIALVGLAVFVPYYWWAARLEAESASRHLGLRRGDVGSRRPPSKGVRGVGHQRGGRVP
jgi:hypothetical protein